MWVLLGKCKCTIILQRVGDEDPHPRFTSSAVYSLIRVLICSLWRARASIRARLLNNIDTDTHARARAHAHTHEPNIRSQNSRQANSALCQATSIKWAAIKGILYYRTMTTTSSIVIITTIATSCMSRSGKLGKKKRKKRCASCYRLHLLAIWYNAYTNCRSCNNNDDIYGDIKSKKTRKTKR